MRLALRKSNFFIIKKINFHILRKKYLYSLSLSILFAFLISAAPWETWRGGAYYDRENYITTIDYSVNQIHVFDFDTLQSKITGEWLWHKTLEFCTETLGLHSTEIMFSITFLICMLSVLFLTTRFHFLSFLFLLNPIFVNFVYSQLRLAFAMSLIFISLYLFKRKNLLFIPIALSTPFIHTAAVIFIGMFGVTAYLHIKIKNQVFKTFASIIIGTLAGIVSGPLMSEILSTIDDRRAEYSDMTSSMAYMSFWMALWAYLILKGLFNKTEKKFDFYLSIMVLSLLAVQTLTEGYPVRFLAACFPFIIAAMLNNKTKENVFVLLFYIAYTVLLWFYWINYG